MLDCLNTFFLLFKYFEHVPHESQFAKSIFLSCSKLLMSLIFHLPNLATGYFFHLNNFLIKDMNYKEVFWTCKYINITKIF